MRSKGKKKFFKSCPFLASSYSAFCVFTILLNQLEAFFLSHLKQNIEKKDKKPRVN
jgi:hypothetical protein